MGRLIKKHALPETPLSLSLGNRDLFSAISHEEAKKRLLEELKPGLMDVATKLATAIVQDTVAQDPNVLEARYHKALSTVTELSPGTVRVHPEGAAHTEIDTLSERAGFRLIADDTLHPADCIICAGDVTVDATVETALYHFKRLFELC
jgi:flagellar biosynthesis/type III secretory pathway protein FliH